MNMAFNIFIQKLCFSDTLLGSFPRPSHTAAILNPQL